MRAKTEGNSTVIISEENDYIVDAQNREKMRGVLDKGGLVIVCRGRDDCEATLRPASEFKTR